VHVERQSQPQASDWRRHFFYRKESLRTTWKLRISIVLFVVLATAATLRFWRLQIAQSLVCAEKITASDALLVENFDQSYLVFERAGDLQRIGIAPRIFLPVASAVSKSVTELMAHLARISSFEIVPIQEIEPISLNAAKQIRDFLKAQGMTSIVVVTPDFRSRRSFLVYNTVFSPAGISVGCAPVFGMTNPQNWTETWHGIQDVTEQFLKLQYYRFYVLL
jgi:hypothetical protein